MMIILTIGNIMLSKQGTKYVLDETKEYQPPNTSSDDTYGRGKLTKNFTFPVPAVWYRRVRSAIIPTANTKLILAIFSTKLMYLVSLRLSLPRWYCIVSTGYESPQ